MYSVFRFIGGPSCTPQQLERMGHLLNASVPGAYQRPDHRGGRFSVSLSTADTWEAHETAILSFLHAAAATLHEARLNDMTLELDIAVEPEDVQHHAYMTLPVSLSLQAETVRHEVMLVFTFSNPAP